uniref:Ig-like domain-containing protein n=2 Tax=Iconisemion striatum TaxID=60296 RepID=A0A1A7YEY8_9TELE
MTAADIFSFTLWISAIVSAGLCCPELCTCTDKHNRHFAECSYKYLTEVPEGLPPNVTTISLSSNRIRFIPLGSFDNVTQVTSLWMAYNEIISIEQGSLLPLFHLRNFDISHNRIIDFPWEDLQNLTALQLLRMNHNEMSNLPRDAFSNLKDLRSLRLNNNKFVTIAEGTFDGLVSLSHLQVYNNPFVCSCSLDWLRDWIPTTTITVPDQSMITCATPEELKGEPILKLPKSKCMSPNVTVLTQPNTHTTTFYEGSELALTCEFKGNPKPLVMWTIHSRKQKHEVYLSLMVDGSAESNEDSENAIRVFNNGTLVISQLRQEDAGNYSCSATNEFGRAEDSVLVKVMTHPKPTPTRPITTTVTSKTFKQTDKTSLFDFLHLPHVKRKDSPTHMPTFHPTAETIPKSYEDTTRFLPRSSKCGLTANTKNISSHVLNGSIDDIKKYTFDFGVIALGVSETEATVRLNPLLIPKDRSSSQVTSNSFQTDSEDNFDFPDVFDDVQSNGLYLCIAADGKHSAVQWSRIKEGINTYQFSGLRPGTNYSLCLTYKGEDCRVQVLFATRRMVPNLLIIISVSICLLTVSTVPLLGATCFHLVYTYRSKTYKLILKAKDQYHLERNLTANFNTPQTKAQRKITEEEMESIDDGDKEADTEESVVTESFTLSHSRGHPDDCEVGSEYSDRLPLGAEAVNITNNYIYPNE